MKKIYWILILSFSIINAQEKKINLVNVTYDCTMINGISKYTTTLIINENQSQFIENRDEKVINNDNFRTTIPALYYINNYDFKTDSIFEQRKIDKNILLKAKWKNNYKWEITNETKIINGYKVIKATTESIEVDKTNPYYYGKAIAWFTPDIPISSGPARYYGLPGLILELNYEKFNTMYLFNKIEYNSTEKMVDANAGEMVEKEDVIYFFHKNTEKIKEIKKKYRK